MQQVYEEKRRVAEEKAQLEAALLAYKDKQHKDSLSNITLEAELSVNGKRLLEERDRLERVRKELDDRELLLKQEKAALEQKRIEIESKSAKLEQMAIAVNQKYTHTEDMLDVGLDFLYFYVVNFFFNFIF
jgi:hypothetical protein